MKHTVSNQNIYYFLLDETIYERLKELYWRDGIHNHGKHNLKFDVLCFFINLISYRSAVSRNKSVHGYVQLNAKILKKYHHQYKVHMDFLVEHGFIMTRTYSIRNHRSKGYKLIMTKKPKKFIKHLPKDFVIRKKISQDKREKKEQADKTTGHLTKWLTSEYLCIIHDEVLKYLDQVRMKDSKKFARRYLIEMLNYGSIYYQREGKDNRLHSILSNCPKDLRSFIRFNRSQTLHSNDMKSSQPFLLAGILNLIYLSKSNSFSKLNNIDKCIHSIKEKEGRDRISSSISTMMQETLEESDIEGIKQFVDLVTQGDLYDYISSQFSEKFIYKIKTPLGISDQFFNKSLGYKEWINFDNIRDYSKKAVMEFLYSSEQNKEARCKEVRQILPSIVSRVVDDLKIEDKTRFPIFLQNLEAYLILDVITKKIANDHPNIPLFTIHDSIITTASNVEIVRRYMQEELCDFFGIAPIIATEEWSFKTSC